jgi:hypothetical protein
LPSQLKCTPPSLMSACTTPSRRGCNACESLLLRMLYY